MLRFSAAILAVSGLLFHSSARADVIPISGSGASGTVSILGNLLPFSAANNQGNGDGSWGIPGLFAGTVNWPAGSPVVGQFSVTFTGLPMGVSIDPVPPPTIPGGSDESTRFSNLTDSVLWDRTIAGNTVTFQAPPGTFLNPGDNFFINVAFDGPIVPANLQFSGAFQLIPEPASLAVFALVGLAGGVYARRRKARVA